MRILALMLCTCLAAPAAMAQQTATPPRPANPAQAPVNPTPSNPAAAPVYPAPDARAAEAGMAPVQPASGVTRRVEEAGNHDIDAQGHTLDPHGKPVGQAPAPTSSR